MSGNGTAATSAGLPMVLTPSMPRSTYRRAAPGAAFLSQLIAERHRLAPQRSRRRAPIAEAVDAYCSTGKGAVVRMPAGYRRTVEA